LSVCKALCDGVMIAQAYSPGEINNTFRTIALNIKRTTPVQCFAAVQVYVEALNTIDKQTDISTMPLEQLRTELNKHLLAGKYETPLGEIAFTPEGRLFKRSSTLHK